MAEHPDTEAKRSNVLATSTSRFILTPNVHNEGRAPLLRASLSIVLLGNIASDVPSCFSQTVREEPLEEFNLVAVVHDLIYRFLIRWAEVRVLPTE